MRAVCNRVAVRIDCFDLSGDRRTFRIYPRRAGSDQNRRPVDRQNLRHDPAEGDRQELSLWCAVTQGDEYRGRERPEGGGSRDLTGRLVNFETGWKTGSGITRRNGGGELDLERLEVTPVDALFAGLANEDRRGRLDPVGNLRSHPLNRVATELGDRRGDPIQRRWNRDGIDLRFVSRV